MAQETDPEQVFEILERMGEGSYGSVWKARHKKSNRIVAVKIIPAESDLNDLMKEITILKECRSEYVIRYYGSYYKDGDLWIVMEFGDCGSLADSLNKEGGLFSEEEMQFILASILLGIAYLHDNRKIHRDIKAGNVLVTRDGKAKLADFGVSAKLDSTFSKRNTVIGTPFWMAPEIIQEISYDGKADIWSLGITAIEIAEGQPPYSNIHPMRAIFMIPNRPPPKLRQNDKWSHAFFDFVETCLVKDPDHRPTARELLQHRFVKNIAIELEANKNASEVMKKMVERLVKRREDLAKLRKDRKNEGGADFGNTILAPNEVKVLENSRMRDSDLSEASTIVQRPPSGRGASLGVSATEQETEPTVREISPVKPVCNPYRMTPAGPRAQPLPPPQTEPLHSTPIPTYLPLPAVNIQARNQFFASGSSCASVSNGHLPVSHVQMSIGGASAKASTDVQRVVLNLMPTVGAKQPSSNKRMTDWMRLRRRGEELRQQFGSDFQVLFDTYNSEIQRVLEEMKGIEENICIP